MTTNNITPWRVNFEKAKRFYTRNGHLWIPTRDEVLYQWVNQQRKEYKKGRLADLRIELLTEIGMSWDNDISPQWMATLKELEKFIETHGKEPNHLTNISLNKWIKRQRARFRKGELQRKQKGLLGALIKLNITLRRTRSKK